MSSVEMWEDRDDGPYVVTWAPCWGCRQVFGFNAHRVPSIVPPGGTDKQPICQQCMDRANAKRAEMGLRPHRILPGAYEPMPAEEL